MVKKLGATTTLKSGTISYIDAYKKKYGVPACDVLDHMIAELKELRGDGEEARSRVKRCHFCGTDTIRFAEHWLFCPECAAIYTHMIVWETSCIHIRKNTPVVRSDCWFKKYREKKSYIEYVNGNQVCSKCGEPVNADGW